MANLLYDADALAAAEQLVICVPGALSSRDIFEPVEAWPEQGYGLVCYRFPGLDGRPLHPSLRIQEAADEIVALVGRYPGKPVRLLGYSTGGPIVISAAAQMTGDVKIAAMSSAVESGGGLRTGLPGLWDVVSSAGRAMSMDLKAVWMEYYRVLLFGRAVLNDKALAHRADALIARHRDRIVMPDGGKPRAHTDDLRLWRLPAGVQYGADQLRFFTGLADPVFSRRQTVEFAARCGADVQVIGYPRQGHLLFLSCETIFDDIRAFFEGTAPEGASEGEVIAGGVGGAGNST